MRYILISIMCFALTACNQNIKQSEELSKKQLLEGPWNGPFGTQMGLTKEQLLRYSSMKAIDVDKQNYIAEAVPNSYGVSFNKIVYTINSIEGLCAIVLVNDSREDVAIVRQQVEAHYGKPSIEKTNFVTWDKQDAMSPVISVSYQEGNNTIKVFYPNFDRCRLK